MRYIQFFYEELSNIIQGDTEENVNILGSDGIGHCEKKNCMNICLIINGYRDRAV